MSASASGKPKRKTYRHGDLRRALLEAGIELAREGGPSAIVLREATRRVGVVPNAAYRHFANHGDLLQAVRAHALAQVAASMEKELALIDPTLPAAHAARAALRGVGLGYLRYALSEPGLFRTAFTVSDPVENDVDAAKAGPGGQNPFQLLASALDRLVQAGVMSPDARLGAEYLAWSAVHGLAFLVIDGPLGQTPAPLRQVLMERLLKMVEDGLTSGGPVAVTTTAAMPAAQAPAAPSGPAPA